MKGYFTRKPENGDEVRAAIKEGYRNHIQPVEIEVLGRIVLTLDEYIHFLAIFGSTTISSSPMQMNRSSLRTVRAASWSARRGNPGWLCASRGTIFPGTAPGLLLTSTSWLRC